jgi:hypothetical protein
MDYQPYRLRGTVREFDKTRGCGTIEGENGQQVIPLS